MDRKLATCAALCALLSGTSVLAQAMSMMPGQLAFEVTAASGVPEIPFDFIHGHIIIPLSVKGSEPFRVGLDTGMPSTSIVLFKDERVDALELEFPPGATALLGGAGSEGKRIEAQIAMGVPASMEGLEITGAMLMVMPKISGLSHAEGIIGAALFKNFVVEINHDDGVIRLHDIARYEAPAQAGILDLDFVHNVAFTQATITPIGSDPFEVTLAVDLGGAVAVSLNTASSEQIVVPAAAIETVLGRGVGGDMLGQMGRVAAVEVAGFRLNDVLANFPAAGHQNPGGMDIRNGILGNKVLSRFNATFDYSRERLYLQPNERFREPFEYDMSGLLLTSDEHGISVYQVLQGSPAAQAGLRVDDVILAVDGKNAREIGRHGVQELLRRDGVPVHLEVRRGSETWKVEVKLRRLV